MEHRALSRQGAASRLLIALVAICFMAAVLQPAPASAFYGGKPSSSAYDTVETAGYHKQSPTKPGHHFKKIFFLLALFLFKLHNKRHSYKVYYAPPRSHHPWRGALLEPLDGQVRLLA